MKVYEAYHYSYDDDEYVCDHDKFVNDGKPRKTLFLSKEKAIARVNSWIEQDNKINPDWETTERMTEKETCIKQMGMFYSAYYGVNEYEVIE